MNNYDFDMLDLHKPTVLLLDTDTISRNDAEKILSSDYNVCSVSSAAMIYDMLASQFPALVLLEADMGDTNGFHILETLKDENSQFKNIPVVMIFAEPDTSAECRAIETGAEDYVFKPYVPTLLMKRVKTQVDAVYRSSELEEQMVLQNYMGNLSEIAHHEIAIASDLRDRILRVVANLLESRDSVTGGHIERTQKGVAIMINPLTERGIYTDEMYGWIVSEVVRSSQLHDVGKIHVPDSILKIPRRLSDDEFSEMQLHTVYGAQVIEKMGEGIAEIEYLRHAKAFAESHHEKWDGSGYPHKLKGTEIPLQGRLLAFADVYDALVSERSYKRPFAHDEAVNIILAGKGTHFDPIMTDVFREVAWKFELKH